MKCPIDKNNISLSFLFYLYIKSQNSYFNDILKDESITVNQIPILLKLLDHDYVYQKDITIDLNMDNAIVTRSLRKLEDGGYILRQEDNENRRQNKISLTDKGRSLTVTLRNLEFEREDEIMDSLAISRDDLIDILIDLLSNSKNFNDKYMGD